MIVAAYTWSEFLRDLHEISWFIGEMLFTHLSAWVGFLLALLITARLVIEKRNPSNVFAWGMIIFFLPYIGVPLYFLFGGRKSKRMAANKKAILELAMQVAGQPDSMASLEGACPRTVSPRRKFNGNSFEFLYDRAGVTYFEAMLREIREAQTSIHIMTYILGRDETGRRLVQALAERAAAGVEVKLLIDAVGSLGRAGGFVKPIRDAGGKVARFMPVLPIHTKTSANLRNHRKIAIFDGKRALVGGQNLDNRFTGPTADPARFVDFSVMISGPAVAPFNRIFVSDWCFASGDKPTDYRELLTLAPEPQGNEVAEILASGPDTENDPLWERLVTMVQEARKQITIVTPYFVPDEVLFRSLMVKAHNSLPIRLILPEKSNQSLVDIARHHFLRQLHKAGVEILFYTPGMVHAKLFIADHEIAMIGSANVDMRSLFLNFEVGVLHTTPEPVRAFEGFITELLPDCVEYSQSEHYRATDNRRIMEDFAHLLVPLL